MPKGLLELNQYFRNKEPINFEFKRDGDMIVAVSTNFQYGSIVTSGKDEKELDQKIKDAILTAFEIPSSYAEDAKIHRVGDEEKIYAYA